MIVWIMRYNVIFIVFRADNLFVTLISIANKYAFIFGNL